MAIVNLENTGRDGEFKQSFVAATAMSAIAMAITMIKLDAWIKSIVVTIIAVAIAVAIAIAVMTA